MAYASSRAHIMGDTQATWGLTARPTGTQRSGGGLVVGHPLRGVLGLDEGEGQGPDAELGRQQDGVAPAAGQPQGWMGLLDRLGDDVSGRHGDELPSTR